MPCPKCNDTGVIDTGNNDLPCSCPAGDAALFNQAGVDGHVTGREVRRHFLNDSPEPLQASAATPLQAADLPGRSRT